ncbi:SAF domain-containing protein [Nocardiopsis sp. HUAS JQ3]|uniref:SAF domain-containing protein n=1 Tax=Nocardiopsis sp. HUAS JQ3 TaxID=3061629 RepID=UPI0023A9139D|nr:SAF domain-containing protein [Nocardiopsis sp. HUAS JQ3]WDZ92826.1 SAF domain-containing protein [Nocardiopsis sp. HUAS JQ3]
MVTTADTRTNGRDKDDPVRLSGRATRRWRSAVVAVALMVAGASAVVVALSQVDQRSPVLVAAGDLPAGHVVTAADVRVVELAGAESLPTASDVEQVVGTTLTLAVTEGALLSDAVLGADGEQLASGQATASVQLASGRVPSSVRTGSQVTVVLTGESSDTASFPAQVQSLTPLTEEVGGEVHVDLVVDGTYAAQLARAAAEDQVSLVQTPHGGD